MESQRPIPPDQQPLPAYFDPELDDEERIEALLSVLTLSEKLACLHADFSIPRLGIRGTAQVEGLHGLALGGPARFGGDAPIATTTYPQAVGIACTWDEACLSEVGAVEAYEARYYFHAPQFRTAGLMVRAPSGELSLDPRSGRIDENFGEDPYLAGVLAAAFVRGLQGDHPRYWMAASLLRHFHVSMGRRDDTREPGPAGSDQRVFREHGSVPFRMAIERGGARAIQVIGGKSAGLPLGAQSLVNDVVVAEWGMDGIVSSDCRAARQLVGAGKPHHSLELALAASIDAGVTQFADEVPRELEAAVEKKLIQLADIDRALRKNLRLMLRLGLLDPEERVPYSSIGRGTQEPWLRPEHQDSVRRVTQKSIVLLKNQSALLPLNAGALRQLAIIGPLADRVLCDWHSGTLPYAVTPVDGLRERLGFERVILASNNDPSEAICAAKAAEVAIVCVGSHPTIDNPWSKADRASFAKELPDRQSLQLEDEELVKLVVAANPKTVLVLISSGPSTIDWSQMHVPAILYLSHNSQELGRAVADVLFGDYNPAGRLVHTWPSSVTNLAPLSESDPREGRTYRYMKGTPLFPFGFGLSYTRFAYSRLLTSSLVITDRAPITVSCDVTNIGRVAGEEVVQLYARYLKPSVPRPQKWLAGFERLEIPPGATRSVRLELRPDSLMFWDDHQHRFVLESGPIELQVGRSSAQIELVCNINAQDHSSLPAPGAAATKRPSQGSSKQQG